MIRKILGKLRGKFLRPDTEKFDAYLVSHQKNIERLENILCSIDHHLSTLVMSEGAWNINVQTLLQKRAVEESADYVKINAPAAMQFGNDWFGHLSFAVRKYQEESSIKDGLFLEFGVFQGSSLNHMSNILAEKTFYGFDSFEGLPDDWHGRESTCQKGTFDLQGKMPTVNSNVVLIKGWFENTLPKFLDDHNGPVALVHVDSDIYDSAKTVLGCLANRIERGTLIIFDEYFGYNNWQQHEFKAFQEFVRNYNVRYEYLSFCTFSAVIRILEISK
ncbi:hypothetical protein AGMMS4952_10290 [Spirochaetia bacterium]|nr:hypothetical protein AGMMS4952_10290 [Spirochaetia bacterium]